MTTMTVTEVRKNWRKVIAAASAGQEITVTRRGKPVGIFRPPRKTLSEFFNEPPRRSAGNEGGV